MALLCEEDMKAIRFALFSFILSAGVSGWAADQKQFREVSFKTADGGDIFGNLYGKGDHAVVLAHGAIFNKESWHPFASTLSEHSYRVLAIDFRGYGKSVPGSKGKALQEDVLAAVSYLQREGAKVISAIGGSMGGGAAAQAAVESAEGDIHRLILLSPVPIKEPERIKAGKLIFIASKDEKLVPRIKDQYKRAPQPKKIVLLEGNAHAQHIFKTAKAQRLTELILEYLAEDHD